MNGEPNRRLCAPHREDVRAIVEDALRPISLGILTRAPGRRFYPAVGSKHSPSEVCDCPSTKPPGRPYHCAA